MNQLIVYIPTLNRENRQITLKSISDNWKDRVFLVCPKHEKHDWPNRVDVPEYCIGNIGKTRQWILDQSPSPFVGQLDDDLIFYRRDSEKLTKNHRLDDIDDMLNLMEKWLKEDDVFCGVSNTFMSHLNDNEYYYGKPSASSFVNRNYLAAHNIRYDDMSYFEDFHVPLSVLESGKRLHYSGLYMSKERKPNAKGGCSTTRTAENNRESMFKLQQLHPKYVKLVEKEGAKNQDLQVNLKMTIFFKKAYDENVQQRSNLDEYFN